MKVKNDMIIYLTQWGICADEMRYVCESNKNGMIWSTHMTYQQAAEWCDKRGYTHN